MTHEQALQHPGVLAGTHRPEKNKGCPGGWQVRDIEKQRAASRRYNASDKKRAARRRYRASEKGRASVARHNGTAKRMIYNIEYAAKRRAS